MSFNVARNEFTIKLIGQGFSDEDIRKVLVAFDITMHDFDIAKKSTDVVPYTYQIPKEVQHYIVSRGIAGLSKKTLNNYLLHIKLFFQTVQKPVAEVSKNDIIVYLYKYKEERHVSDRSLDSIRQYIAGFFRWCVDEEIINKDPSKNVPQIKYEKKERESMTSMELEKIRSSCESIREKALVEFLASTACRVSEAANVKLSDIDLESGEVTLFGKGKKYRTGYLSPRAIIAVRNYILTREGDCENLFCSSLKPYGPISTATLQREIKHIAERAEIDKHITPHVFRHTSATLSLDRGMKVEEAQKMLGHSNVATTMVYIHQNKNAVKEAHRRCAI